MSTPSTIHAPSPGVVSKLLLDGISVVLPAHNEEENLAEAVREAIAAAEQVSRRQEVIVVDDGSSDYGCAIRSGIAAARMDWVLLTDADLQFDLSQLTEFVPHTSDAELVVGYRAQRNDPPMRRLNARGWNALVHLLFHLPVRDVDAAFKLIRRDTLDGVDLISTGASIDTELLAKAGRNGARIVELPVVHRPRLRGEASGANLHVIIRAFREVFRVWRSMHARLVPPLEAASEPPCA
jgi:glycosyltransferase involved in cell wall biosynthesis